MEICENCDSEVDEVTDILPYGELCDDCLEDEFVTCPCCDGKARIDGDTVLLSNGDRVCGSCFNSDHFECEYCDENFHHDDGRNDGYIEICEDCYCDEYFTCHDCAYIYRNYDAHEVNWENYCADCVPVDDEESHELIQCYSAYPNCGMKWYSLTSNGIHSLSTTRERSPDRALYYGIEAETVFASQESRNHYLETLDDWCASEGMDLHELCVPQEDGSICEYKGVEFVFQPHTKDALAKRFESMPWPDSNLLDLTTKAGCHVNMSRDPFADDVWARFIRFIYLQKQYWIGQSRRPESSYYFYLEDMNKVTKDNMRVASKYRAANIQDKRIEVRSFLGVYSAEAMNNYVAVCDDLIHFCQDLTDEEFKLLEMSDTLLTSFEHYRNLKAPLKLFFKSNYTGLAHLTDFKNYVYQKVGA